MSTFARGVSRQQDEQGLYEGPAFHRSAELHVSGFLRPTGKSTEMLILLAFVNLPLNVSAERHQPRAGSNGLQEALRIPANRNSLARVKGSGQLTWLRPYDVLASGAAIQEANRFYRYGPPASVDAFYDDCIYPKLFASHPQQADLCLLNATC